MDSGSGAFDRKPTDSLSDAPDSGIQEIAGQREIELLYTIAASEWRKGLATEMARAIVSVAFEKLHLSEIVAITLATNIASRRVLEHVGFEYERDVSWAGRRHVLYRRFFAKF